MSESGNLLWLRAILVEKKVRIGDLLRRLTNFGMRGSLKPALLAKFLDLLDQLACQREKERELIHKIEEVESRHRHRRHRNELERANPDFDPVLEGFENDSEFAEILHEKRKRHNRLLWLLDLWPKPGSHGNCQ